MSKMNLTKPQCEALTDILVLAMCIDGHFSLKEEENIQSKIEGLTWAEDFSPGAHLPLSIARSRDIVDSPEKLEAYLQKRAGALGDTEAKTFVLERTLEVLGSDGIKAEEGTFISQLRRVLGV